MLNFNELNSIFIEYKKFFLKKNFLLCGSIKINDFYFFFKKNSIFYIEKYDQWKLIYKNYKNTYFNTVINKKIVKKINVVIYFWPKDKKEAIFQILNILSVCSKKTEIFIVGRNKSGINSCMKLFQKWIFLKKKKYKKKCSLFHGIILKNTYFSIKNFYHRYIWNNIKIYVLPGVFGYKKIDEGTKLLISTIKNIKNKKVLDLCCGVGIIGIYIKKNFSTCSVTLSDNSKYALNSSKKTCIYNNIQVKIIPSNLYEDIHEKFNLIFSNPPYHENLSISTIYIKKIIFNSKKYLFKKGILRIVLNNFLSIKNIIPFFKIIKKNNKFTVYEIKN
ncbi:methyltransferase [Buchnera aphidicola (Kurisakia onigurumii)]|uniref:methyltransferase n=1 Tax=Buchnera aphidicola TaxID=9 RepID=UPI0031B679FD